MSPANLPILTLKSMGPAARCIILATVYAPLAACGGGANSRVCFGSTEFCSQAFAANRSPEADAGPDLTVNAGDRTRLDGSGSRDRDGRIASYSWSQQSGPPVALSQATSAVASFDAPDVLEPTSLVFRLVVTDDDDASDSDHVVVSIAPAEAAALRQAVAQLDRAPPASCADAAAGCWTYLSLWLGARLSAAEALGDPDPTRLLDLVRVLQITEVEAAPLDALPAPTRRLLVLGQHAVAGFTATRDPATAERARHLAHGPVPGLIEWLAALDALHRTVGLRPTEARAAATLVRALRLTAQRDGRLADPEQCAGGVECTQP